jgi:hypothetical protein
MSLQQIRDYIQSEISKPYRDGETDCCNTADRWVTLRKGFSPLLRFGRPVKCSEDVQEWLSERWGLVGGVLRVMRSSGFPCTKDPAPGDVGLVITKKEVCMAVFTGKFWFTRNERGVMFIRREAFLRAWSV